MRAVDEDVVANGRADTALQTRRLPDRSRWIVTGCAVAAAAAGYLAGFTTSLASTGLVAAVLFVAGYTGWSFACEGRRHAVDRLATTVVHATFVIAVIPLVAILGAVVVRGLGAMSGSFVVNSMRNVSPRSPGGGVGHALIGTIEQITMACVVAVPIGLLAAIYLVEYGRSRLASAISFFVDVMTGVPSIVAGLFIFTGLVLTAGMERSGFAASLALVILMLPVVVKTAEEMLRIVPAALREAAYALGIPKWRTILRIVLPTAMSGIVTGVMLAVARVTGETAPLLLTTFLSQSVNWDLFHGPQTALPLFVWDQIASGTSASIDRAWAGALALILLVAMLYVTAKLVARRVTAGVGRNG